MSISVWYFAAITQSFLYTIKSSRKNKQMSMSCPPQRKTNNEEREKKNSILCWVCNLDDAAASVTPNVLSLKQLRLYIYAQTIGFSLPTPICSARHIISACL